ncbi:MAG: hypothetical protein GXY34_08945 [Syntrophomonadaceae bacterium]|nr:hypothetical protein [Syntrophomonadaceae bacterium]
MLRNKSAAIFLLFLFLTGCSGGAPKEATAPGEEEPVAMATDHRLYKHFLAAYGEKTPLLTGVNDINDDGQEDLIVIYQDTPDTNKMIAIWEQNGEMIVSKPTPAPVENYRIEWRDIDNKAPIELVVSGSKGVNIGYAIYRWENGNLINLFGEGMEKCC